MEKSTGYQADTWNSYHEAVSHGDVMFPFMEYVIETDATREERIYCHWHEELEFLVLTEGEAKLSIGEQTVLIKAGDFAFIPSDKLHTMSAKTGTAVSFYAFDFSPAFLYSFENDLLQQQYFLPLQKGKLRFLEFFTPDCAWKKELAQNLQQLHEIFQQKRPGYELLIKAKLYEIFAQMFVFAVLERTSGQKDRREQQVRKMMQYLQQNYDQVITMEELSEAFHLSVGHLCRLFKSMTGRSVIDYLNDYRIRQSTQLLRERQLDIGEIAGKVGFNNISYFNKRFRQYMHMTPGEYRKRTI